MTYEDDISAEEETEIQSTRIPQQDEYKGRQKSSPGQKSQGKKSSFRIKKVWESFEAVFETLLSYLPRDLSAAVFHCGSIFLQYSLIILFRTAGDESDIHLSVLR